MLFQHVNNLVIGIKIGHVNESPYLLRLNWYSTVVAIAFQSRRVNTFINMLYD